MPECRQQKPSIKGLNKIKSISEEHFEQRV